MVYIVILDSLAPRYCHRPYYFLFLYLLKYTFLHPLARMKPRDPTYWYFNNRLLCGISDVQPTWFLEVANNTYLFLIIPVLCHHCYQCPFLYFCVICLLMMISIYVPQSLFSSDCLKILKKKKYARHITITSRFMSSYLVTVMVQDLMKIYLCLQIKTAWPLQYLQEQKNCRYSRHSFSQISVCLFITRLEKSRSESSVLQL